MKSESETFVLDLWNWVIDCVAHFSHWEIQAHLKPALVGSMNILIFRFEHKNPFGPLLRDLRIKMWTVLSPNWLKLKGQSNLSLKTSKSRFDVKFAHYLSQLRLFIVSFALTQQHIGTEKGSLNERVTELVVQLSHNDIIVYDTQQKTLEHGTFSAAVYQHTREQWCPLLPLVNASKFELGFPFYVTYKCVITWFSPFRICSISSVLTSCACSRART